MIMTRNDTKRKKQRKIVTVLAAFSRKYTVNNCTIPKADESLLEEKKVKWGTIKVVKGTAEWKIPAEGYKQPKNLHKKQKERTIKCKTGTRVLPARKSEFPDYTFKPKGKSWYMEQVVQHKLAKWEKKNPRPIKQGDLDLFEKDFLGPWMKQREEALEHIRDVVVSMYDKLHLIGRFEKSESSYSEELVAEIKDKTGEGHKINDLDPKKSKLLKKVQKKTNEVKTKRKNLVATNLRDHMRLKGRILLPKVA